MCERDMSIVARCFVDSTTTIWIYYAFFSDAQKKESTAVAENRKSKFASINCEHGYKIGWTTSMAAETAISVVFFSFSFFLQCWCHLHLASAWFLCTLNSRTPRIYMLMMVCWLTKLLQRNNQAREWKKAYTHFGPKNITASTLH